MIRAHGFRFEPSQHARDNIDHTGILNESQITGEASGTQSVPLAPQRELLLRSFDYEQEALRAIRLQKQFDAFSRVLLGFGLG